MAKKTKRELQAIDTKKHIFETAIKLIRIHGYENVSLNNISTESGVSIGGIYHHYDSKYDIIIDTFKNGDHFINTKAMEFFKTNSNPEDRLIEVIRLEMTYAQYLGVDLVRQMYKNEMQVKNNFLISEGHSYNKLINDIVEEAIKNNDFNSDFSSKQISEYIIFFTRGIIYDWCLYDASFDITKFSIEAISDILTIFRNKNK